MPPRFLKLSLSPEIVRFSVHRSRLEVKRVEDLALHELGSGRLFAGSPLTNTSEWWRQRSRELVADRAIPGGSRPRAESGRVGQSFAFGGIDQCSSR